MSNLINISELAEAVQRSAITIDGLTAELEDFDKQVSLPIWGKLQQQLIALQDSYEHAIGVLQAVKLGEVQATEREQLIEQIAGVAAEQVKESLGKVSLSELFYLSGVGVGVSFDKNISTDTVH